MLVPNAWCLLAILAFACGDEEDKSDGPNRKAVKSGEYWARFALLIVLLLPLFCWCGIKFCRATRTDPDAEDEMSQATGKSKDSSTKTAWWKDSGASSLGSSTRSLDISHYEGMVQSAKTFEGKARRKAVESDVESVASGAVDGEGSSDKSSTHSGPRHPKTSDTKDVRGKMEKRSRRSSSRSTASSLPEAILEEMNRETSRVRSDTGTR